MGKHILLTLMMALVIAACSPTAEEPVVEDVQEAESIAQQPTETAIVVQPTTEPATVEPTVEVITIQPTIAPTVEIIIAPTLEPTVVPSANAYNAPEWTTIQLVNAQTGDTFTLADFAGKTVFVEPMATWCSNCRAQQGNVAQAMGSLNADEFVFISLSVGENVSNETLASYAMRNNFPQLFVVAPDELTRSLVDTFGFTVSSPPATPHFTISPTGTVSSLYTGFHNADTLVQQALEVQGS